MTMRKVFRNPLAAVALGVLIGAAPLAAIYSTRTAQAANPPPEALTSANPRGGVAVELPDFSTLIKRYAPAVVAIKVVEKPSGSSMQQPQGNPFGPNSPFAPFFRSLPYQHPEPVEGLGSGFIIRPDGLIVTNAHVVAGASKITVELHDRREYPAKVIGMDKISDIAVIKIPAHNLPTVTLGNSKSLRVGQWVLAIGMPFGFDYTATAGIVSALGRVLPNANKFDYVPFIQTDVPINPGNSGGPLINMQGQVVGINSEIYSRSGGYMGLSFSIPINVAMHVADQLIASGHVERGELGILIQPVNQVTANAFGLPRPEGALVTRVNPGSPAQAAGIKSGDVILALDGHKIERMTDLPARVASLLPGTVVHPTVWRNHAEHVLTAKLGAMGTNGLLATNDRSGRLGGRLGLVVRPLTAQEQQQDQVHGGLEVEGVSGPALDAGIQPGDIVLSANGQSVSTPNQLNAIVNHAKDGDVALLIKNGDVTTFVPVQAQ
jgi:serine protease Do